MINKTELVVDYHDCCIELSLSYWFFAVRSMGLLPVILVGLPIVKVRSDQIVILSYVLMSCRVPKIMELRLEFLVTFRTIKSKNHEFIISLCRVIETFLSQVHYYDIPS